MGLPVSEPEGAVSVFAPAVVPSGQLPTVATPPAFVVVLRPVAEPPPEATANVTEVPATGLPYVSVTLTDGAVTFVFTVTLWLSPAFRASVAAAAAVPVALKVTEVRPVELAVSWFRPAPVPSFHHPSGPKPPPLVD